jgi:CopG family transcriptional regulator/antitoxin EndoAI
LPRLKKVVVGLPEDTLAGIDTLVSDTNLCRSELIREACSFYIEEKRRQNLRERMKAGYQEMAELNRLLAEEIASDFCTQYDQYDDSGWRKV